MISIQSVTNWLIEKISNLKSLIVRIRFVFYVRKLILSRTLSSDSDREIVSLDYIGNQSKVAVIQMDGQNCKKTKSKLSDVGLEIWTLFERNMDSIRKKYGPKKKKIHSKCFECLRSKRIFLRRRKKKV